MANISNVYIGYNANSGLAKIGQTTRKINEREKEIRRAEKGYAHITHKTIIEPQGDDTVSLAVEGHMRLKLAQAGYIRQGNDHFQVPHNMLKDFLHKAKTIADEYCEYAGIGHSDWS